MEDARIELVNKLGRMLDENRRNRDDLWATYWEGRRMVTVPDGETAGEIIAEERARANAMKQNPLIRPFESFPNLIKDRPHITTWEPPTITPIALKDAYDHVKWDQVIRDCIARLKSAREKESTNRNLSTLLAVVVKVQKDLESLVGESRDWQRDDATVEKHVTLDDRHSAEAL